VIDVFEELRELCETGPADLPHLPQSFRDWMLMKPLPILYGSLIKFNLALSTGREVFTIL